LSRESENVKGDQHKNQNTQGGKKGLEQMNGDDGSVKRDQETDSDDSDDEEDEGNSENENEEDIIIFLMKLILMKQIIKLKSK